MQPGLTESQLHFFRAFGYVVLRKFFTPAEVTQINREVDETMLAQYPHKPFDGSCRHWTMMMDEDTPLFATMLEDPRFLTVAQQIYGPDVLGICADANRYVGDTGWHPDTATELQYGIKFAFYLRPVGTETGALRVIPATHRFPVHDPNLGPAIAALPLREVPCAVLESEPGDVIGFDLRTWHASCGGGVDRRMCTVVYYNNPKTAEEAEYIRKQGGSNVEIAIKGFDPRRKFLYSRSWMNNPRRNPARQAWIDRLGEVGYFDHPGVVEGGWRESEAVAGR